jgi:hypothetical protein
MEIKKNERIIGNYVCSVCDFKCSYISDWKRHLTRRKHKLSHKKSFLETFGTEKNEKNESHGYTCDICSRNYKTKSGLWKHKKICVVEETEIYTEADTVNTNTNIIVNTEKTHTELIMMLIKENAEFKNIIIEQQNKMMEVIKNGTHTTNNLYNTHNINNKTFNLQFFLNETCKDAMNLMEFVESIKLQLTDLERVGQIGYVEGISKVFINNLKDIDYTKRPIHCSDEKRETIYIKDENQWTKDDENKTGLTKAIKHVANKNIKMIPEWTKENPDYNDSASKTNDKYFKLVFNSMSGSTKEEANKNYEKIVKNIIKETVIEK